MMNKSKLCKIGLAILSCALLASCSQQQKDNNKECDGGVCTIGTSVQVINKR